MIFCDPSIYTMNHPDLTVSDLMGNTIGPKRVNGYRRNYHCNQAIIVQAIDISFKIRSWPAFV